MHLLTILAFVCLFWQAEIDEPWRVFPGRGLAWSFALILVYWTSVGIIGRWITARVLRLLDRDGTFGADAQKFHFRATLFLRGLILGGFGFLVLATPWCDRISLRGVSAWLQVLSDIVTLLVYVIACALLWFTAYPLEKRMHDTSESADSLSAAGTTYRLRSYLDANLRHHVLVVAAPMTLILFGSNVIRANEDRIVDWIGSPWGADLALGCVAAIVFVISPAILRRVWHTEPLPPGPLRLELEALCGRIGLRCRDILVWRSDGMMMNAAVMGVVAPLRYVLLSDTLVSTMSPRQIEAVFGHEAGHVRHRHIEKFLIFAFVGWLAVAGTMEIVAWWATKSGGQADVSGSTVQTIGLGTTGVAWLLVFGWISRRFEWQADVFGAACAAPEADRCDQPCARHGVPGPEKNGESRVCMTGATVFASALERVAVTNGIPRDEPSWRHSSIAHRVAHLMALAGDPAEAARFGRITRRISQAIWIAGAVGVLICAWYWTRGIEPAMLRLAVEAR